MGTKVPVTAETYGDDVGDSAVCSSDSDERQNDKHDHDDDDDDYYADNDSDDREDDCCNSQLTNRLPRHKHGLMRSLHTHA